MGQRSGFLLGGCRAAFLTFTITKMNDTRTSNPPIGANGFPLGSFKLSFRFYRWWILWALFAQVDCLIAADSITGSSQYPGGTSYFLYANQAVVFTRNQAVPIYHKSGSGGTVYTMSSNTLNYSWNERYKWSGLASGVTATGVIHDANPADRTFYWGTSVGAVTNAIPMVPADSVTVTFGGSYGHVTVNREAAAYTLNVADGTYTQTAGPTATPAGPITTLEKFFGKTLNVPYYVAAGVTNVAVEINGVVHNFPVQTVEGDSGGVAMLALPIPQGWNGSAKINGVDVALAPRVAYTGTPTMGLTANPYQDATEPLALPAGMSRGVPALPAGMTPQQYYGLPAGMTAATKLPLPAGVTAINQSAPVAGTLPVGVTSSGGGMGWVTVGPTGTAKPGSTTATGVSSGSSTASGTGLSDADKEAIVDSGLVGSGGDETKAGAGLKDLGNTWNGLKTTVQGKFGAFRPLQAGSVPKASSLDFTLPLGPYGSRTVNLDLTQPPFSTARALALVLLIAGSGWWFLKFVKV